jgi:hypothetical protein
MTLIEGVVWVEICFQKDRGDLKHVLADTKTSMQEDKVPSVEGNENLSSILKS